MLPAYGLLMVVSFCMPPPTVEATMLKFAAIFPKPGPMPCVVPPGRASQMLLLPVPSAMYSNTWQLVEGSIAGQLLSTKAVQQPRMIRGVLLSRL